MENVYSAVQYLVVSLLTTHYYSLLKLLTTHTSHATSQVIRKMGAQDSVCISIYLDMDIQIYTNGYKWRLKIRRNPLVNIRTYHYMHI